MVIMSFYSNLDRKHEKSKINYYYDHISELNRHNCGQGRRGIQSNETLDITRDSGEVNGVH